jgi:signal transduction histidine kinase
VRSSSTPTGLPRRRPGIRDAGIRAKLGTILVIPILAIVSLTIIRLVDSGQHALSARLVSALTAFSSDVSETTQQLQHERILAVEYLDGDLSGAVFTKQAEQTTASITTLKDHSRINRLPAPVRGRLDRIEQQLSTVDGMRQQILKHQDITPAEVVVRYGAIIDDLVGYHGEIAPYATDTHLADSLRAMAAFVQAKAQAAEEQAIGYAALRTGPIDEQQYTAFVATLTGQQSALTIFEATATPEQSDVVNSTVTGDAVNQADLYEQLVARSLTLKEKVSAADLVNTLGAVLNLMRVAEQRLDRELADDAKLVQTATVRGVVAESVIVLVAIAMAIAVAFALARALSRSLFRLREGAMAVVGRELPNAVARLRDVRDVGEMTPENILAQLKDPVPIDSRDEIGQVAQAFNAVHREAVRVAAEQATLRTSVSAMFLNLARRSQSLVDRMIGELDTIERSEEDPKRLAQLFQLDHLATRMRRNDENLLVLAGADSGSPRRENALLADVLRAAQSEVEQYNRIEFGTVDLDVAVISHAVNDVVRLMAELLDNATRFSPPDSAVVVEGRRIGDYVLLQIEDRGLGMAPEQLDMVNERLAEPPTVDVTAFRMMGLAVVSRLASRYRIKVELRPNPEGGTVTGITLPTNILVLPRLRGREPVIARPRPPLPLEAVPTPSASARPMPQLPGLAPAGSGTPTGLMTASRPEPEPVAPRTTFEVPLARPVDSTRYATPAPVAPPTPASAPPPAPGRVPEDTTEMPIFRSMEAVWFKGSAPPPVPRAATPPPAVPPAPVISSAEPLPQRHRTTPMPSTPTPSATPMPSATPPGGATPPGNGNPDEAWRTSADAGWRAAAAAATPKDGGTTRSGLPKRVPAAQLVPGAVDPRGTAARTKRTPDEVRGLLSAYHRGVQRGRTSGEGSSFDPRSNTEETH